MTLYLTHKYSCRFTKFSYLVPIATKFSINSYPRAVLGKFVLEGSRRILRHTGQLYFYSRGVRAVTAYTQGSHSLPRSQSSPSGSGAMLCTPVRACCAG
eukprot:SAG11_NODE_4805_length_1760_cov_2.247441_1_plen_98_part_10